VILGTHLCTDQSWKVSTAAKQRDQGGRGSVTFKGEVLAIGVGVTIVGLWLKFDY
jgi:hypothetical protein